MKTKYLMALGAITLVASTTAAFAGGKYCEEREGEHGHYKSEHHGEMKGMMGERRLEKMAKYLELTEAQKTEVQGIFTAQAEKMKERRETAQSFHQQMRELNPGDAGYVDAVKKLADAHGDMMAAKMVERAEVKAELYAVLTPAQQEKMSEMRDHREKKGDDHHWGGKSH